MNEERRRDPRIKAAADILVKIQSAPGARELEGQTFPANSMDLSISGLCMRMNLTVPIRSLLELKITFPNANEHFWFTGNIVWHDQKTHIAGIQFNLIDNPRYHAWKQAIARLTPPPAL